MGVNSLRSWELKRTLGWWEYIICRVKIEKYVCRSLIFDEKL